MTKKTYTQKKHDFAEGFSFKQTAKYTPQIIPQNIYKTFLANSPIFMNVQKIRTIETIKVVTKKMKENTVYSYYCKLLQRAATSDIPNNFLYHTQDMSKLLIYRLFITPE